MENEKENHRFRRPKTRSRFAVAWRPFCGENGTNIGHSGRSAGVILITTDFAVRSLFIQRIVPRKSPDLRASPRIQIARHVCRFPSNRSRFSTGVHLFTGNPRTCINFPRVPASPRVTLFPDFAPPFPPGPFRRVVSAENKQPAVELAQKTCKFRSFSLLDRGKGLGKG